MPEYSNNKQSLGSLLPLITAQLEAGGSASFTTRGTSMTPTLKNGEGSVTVVKPSFPLKKYDIPLYRRADGSFVLHRIIKLRPEGYVCRGDNQKTNEYPVKDDMIIAVVAEYDSGKGAKNPRSAAGLVYAFYIVHTARIRLFIKALRRNAISKAKKLFAKNNNGEDK